MQKIALGSTSFLISGTAIKKLVDPTKMIPPNADPRSANMLTNIAQVLSGFQLGLMYLNICALLGLNGAHEGLAHFALVGNLIAFSIATVPQFRYPMDISIKIWGAFNIRPGVFLAGAFALLNAIALIL